MADDFIVFTPTNGFSGSTKFNYTISDGSLTSTASVAIAVGANITGTNGNDTISGTPGDDKICGGNGNDTIYGGKGNDILTGGNGKDKFIFASKEGTDTVTDFRKGTDLIGLSGGLTFGQLSFCGNNILVSSTQEILAKLTGINTNTLIASDFIIV